MADDIPQAGKIPLPTNTAHTTPKTTREDARRALSGEFDAIPEAPFIETPPPHQPITNKSELMRELTEESLPSYTPTFKKEVAAAHPIATPHTTPKPFITHAPVPPPITKPLESKPKEPIRFANPFARESLPPQPAPTQPQKPLPTPASISLKTPTAKGTSLADIALSQEATRREQEEADFIKEKMHPYRRILILGGAILVFALGGAVAIYFAVRSETPGPLITIDKTEHQFLLKPDVTYTLPLGKTTTDLKKQFSEAISKENKSDGTIGAFVITTEDEKKKQTQVSPVQVLTTLYPQVPHSFVQSLSAQYMAGRFAGTTQNSAFFVFGIASYENAFAGLENWYPQDALSFAQLLKNNGEAKTNNLEWKSVFIKNIDARILANSDDDIFIAYTFLTRDKLLIAADKESFIALVERYTTPLKPVQ